MKKRMFSLILSAVVCLSMAVPVFGASEQGDVTILFETDVHCAVDGYAKLAALKAEEEAKGGHVALVSSGDFLQGGTLGAVSQGAYIAQLMNMLSYDAAALGNHEFDYQLLRLLEIDDILEADLLSANFVDLATGKAVFAPYSVKTYGDVKVGFVGITTPDAISSSSPGQFVDDNGNYIYGFSGEELAKVVQTAIDGAKQEGADFVVALSHLGSEDVLEKWSVQTLISQTKGLNVVLDGHSHVFVNGLVVNDAEGMPIPVAAAGTGLSHAGKLVLSEGSIHVEYINLEKYEKSDPEVVQYIEAINAEFQEMGQRVVGNSVVKLCVNDEEGNRLIRSQETNLGNFCADAYRRVTGAQIGLMNGGGIRADIEAGEITFADLLAVFPWSNKVCVAEATGQQILDLLEMGVMNYPEEAGVFQQVSGIRFDIDPSIESTVVLDANTNFLEVAGARRVRNVSVINEETYLWEPLDPAKTYTVASHNYLLQECGDGATMFRGSEVTDTGMLDVEMLERYLTEHLGGSVEKGYRKPSGNINILSAYVPLRKSFEDMGYTVIWTPEAPQKILVTDGLLTFEFFANSDKLLVGGIGTYQADRATYIEDGVTYISADCVEFVA